MKYSLFLDDERQLFDVKWVQLPWHHKWLIARNYGEFVDLVMDLGLPEFVSFDHDLADFHYKIGSLENESGQRANLINMNFNYGSEKTGFDAMKWLVGYCSVHEKKFPPYAIHSLNGVAAERMETYIKQAKEHLGI